MQAETLPPNPESPLLKAYLCYRCLIEGCACAGPTETGLGGKLLYAGELDPVGSAIVLAGNVAGCATLAATADAAAQKQAIRNGIVDFLVTSLDEALRILKNEIRKHATVAVCVGVSTGEIEREMQERGVQPDLGRESAICDRSETEPLNPDSIPNTLVWRVESSPAKWLPKLDAIALECLALPQEMTPADHWNRRWIRLSPRYLNRVAPNQRIIHADREFSVRFIDRIGNAFDRGEISTQVTMWARSEAGFEEHHFPSTQQHEVVTPLAPPSDSKAP